MEAIHCCIRPIIMLHGKSCHVLLVNMNRSSHSSKQDVSGFHMLSGWHANPSWHISAGVFLLWLSKLLHGGQHVRLIQLRGQQARVIEMLPSHSGGGGLRAEGIWGVLTEAEGDLLILSIFLHLRTTVDVNISSSTMFATSSYTQKAKCVGILCTVLCKCLEPSLISCFQGARLSRRFKQ